MTSSLTSGSARPCAHPGRAGRELLEPPAYLVISDERVEGPPHFHINGIPCRRVRVGFSENGKGIFKTFRCTVSPSLPSSEWREGC